VCLGNILISQASSTEGEGGRERENLARSSFVWRSGAENESENKKKGWWRWNQIHTCSEPANMIPWLCGNEEADLSTMADIIGRK